MIARLGTASIESVSEDSSADGVSSDLARTHSFAEFYRQALPTVFGYFVNRCGGSRSAAEDLTQETFMAAVRELKRGGSVVAPIPWILGIARHKLVDHFRREERAERNLTLAFQARVPDEVTEWSAATREEVLGALGSVAATQRAALILRYLDGMSVEEVAAALGRSIHATESLLARGRDSFRRAFMEATDG